MLTFVNNLIVSCSKSWWKFLLLLSGQIGTISLLNNITEGFPAISGGHKPFDMQNSLQADEIFLQLATYTPEAFSQYSLFQMVDYVFPVFGGLVLACAVAFALRHASPILYQRVLDTRVLFLLLIPTIFDWLENINLLWAIKAWPEQTELAAQLAVASKLGKLSSIYCIGALAMGLLCWALVRWISQRFTSD